MPPTADTLAARDCVILVTGHDAFDHLPIGGHSGPLVDTRGRFRGHRSNVVRARPAASPYSAYGR